jgi:hypothetical protein
MVTFTLRDSGEKWPEDLDCALCGDACNGTLGWGGWGTDKPCSIICRGCGFWISYTDFPLDTFREWAQYDPFEHVYLNGFSDSTHGRSRITKRPPLFRNDDDPRFPPEQPALFKSQGPGWDYSIV